jgi:hypothetical protein
MTENFRALCEELLRSLENYPVQPPRDRDLCIRARDALNKQPDTIGPEWQPCVKLPITVHVREQRPGETHSSTREGLTPLLPDDLIMRGVQGEEYPIGRELFEQTYRMGATELEGPTHKELWELYDERGGEPEHGPWVRDYARAVLARWGCQ